MAAPRAPLYPFGPTSTSIALGDTIPNAPENATAARRTGAFALPAASRDTALVLTLEPGAYTAQLSSATGTTGAAMIELYVVDF